MKRQTLRVVLEVGVPIFVGYLPGKKHKVPEMKELVTLDSFKVFNGIIHWTVIDGNNGIHQGGLLTETSISKNLDIKLAIPVVLNKRWNGLAPEFLITTDIRYEVCPLSVIKNKYLNKSDNLFQSITGG